MSTINEQLFELYSSKWDKLSPALQNIANGSENSIPPTNPFLLYVDEEQFKNADVRVMIFGQETQDWEGLPGKDIARLRYVYKAFCGAGGYNSPYWQAIAKIKALFNAKYPQKQTGYVVNNLIKIGKAGKAGCPPRCNYEVERELFHVIPDEVRIINPNVIVFLTGPNYDGVIRDNFGDVSFAAVPPFNKRQFAKLSIPGRKFAFRTYHPRYLHRQGGDYRDNIFKTIVNDIEF